MGYDVENDTYAFARATRSLRCAYAEFICINIIIRMYINKKKIYIYIYIYIYISYYTPTTYADLRGGTA